MFYKFNSFLVIIFFCNTFFSQSLSSAPHTVKDIYHSSQSLWLIGESDQNGGGVYKYENKKWYYFKIENAERITATSSNIPVIINNAKHLLILKNNQWIKIANNVKCISGSYRNNHIWAVINNELQLYKNNNWISTNYNQMIIEEISEAKDGTLFTLNSSKYLFQSKGNNWEIVNSIKGEKISTSINGNLYLTQEVNSLSDNNVKRYTNKNWTNLPLNAKKLVSNSHQLIYYIDAFNRLFEKNGDDCNQISNNQIVSHVLNGNNSYVTNPYEIDSTTGETSLFKSIRNSDINAMFEILSQGADINKKNNNLETPLIVALQIGDYKLISSLIGLKPNLENFDKNSKNALWYAVSQQDTASVELLMTNGADPNALDYLNQIVDFKNSNQKKTKLIFLFLRRGVKVTYQQIKKLIILNHEQNYFQLINSTNKVSISKDNYDQFLNEAIKVNNIKIAKNCIENGANPNLLMSFAIDHKDKALMLFLLSKNANSNVVIKYSIQNNDEELLWTCIDIYGGSKEDALKYSCEFNKIKYAASLLENGANPNGPMKMMIKKNDTSFVSLLLSFNADGSDTENFKSAIKNKSIEMVNLLLNNGAKHNDGIITAIEVQSLEIVNILLPESDKENIDLIETACLGNNLEIIELLLTNGSNPQNGLDAAIKANKLRNVNLLIKNGARINSDQLLINAVKTKNLDLVKVLVQNAISHVDTIINYGIDISAGIKYAVNQNSPEIVNYLLQNAADQSKSAEYFTIAVNKNYLATLKTLIKNGLNPNVIDEEKNTLIHISCIKNYYAVTKELIETNKIDINAFNEDGMSPLMYVVKVKRKDIKMCQLLVENGADVNARDDFGTVVRKMAKGCRVKKYLKKNGAFRK